MQTTDSTTRELPGRWTVLGLLTGFSVISYMLRVNISITAKLMMPELLLSDIQMGQVFSSFMVGYCFLQVPAGMLGDRYGPRLVLAGAALVWGTTTLLTGLIPRTIAGGSIGVYVGLLIIRFILGAAEAATYPVAARAVANWVPRSRQAVGNALVLAGMPIGSAITPPLVAFIMVAWGWRQSFFVTAGFAFLIATLWILMAVDHPEEQHFQIHEGRNKNPFVVTSAERVPGPITTPWYRLISERNILLLCVSYFFEGYVLFMFVFWLYSYLVDVRKFSLLAGGIFASAPWILASLTTPAGGVICDRLSRRFGRLHGSRLLVVSTYSIAALVLFLGIDATDRYFAVAALSMSVGCVMMAEPAFWSSAIDLGRTQAGATSGIMNTAGILGGIISTAFVPILVKYFGWQVALRSGCGVALACGLVWFGIQSSNREVPDADSDTPGRAAGRSPKQSG